MSTNLNWFQARDLGKAGSKVRRNAWQHWLYFKNHLWFINADGPDRVVHAADFGRPEFLAKDWTDEAWDTPVLGGGGTGGAGGTGGSGGSGGSTGGTGGGGTGGGGTFGAPGGDERSFGSTSGAGGNGSDEPPGPGPTPPPNNSHSDEPAADVAVTPADAPLVCYPPDDVPPTIDLWVNVTIPSGPDGNYFIEVELSTQTKLGLGYSGSSSDFLFKSVPFSPGGTFTATVTITANGTDYNFTGTYTTRPLCGTSC